jgi:hypothetical protein
MRSCVVLIVTVGCGGAPSTSIANTTAEVAPLPGKVWIGNTPDHGWVTWTLTWTDATAALVVEGPGDERVTYHGRHRPPFAFELAADAGGDPITLQCEVRDAEVAAAQATWTCGKGWSTAPQRRAVLVCSHGDTTVGFAPSPGIAAVIYDARCVGPTSWRMLDR